MDILIIIIIILILLLILSYYYSYSNIENFNNLSPKIIWSYWENKNNNPTPAYILLCFETFYKHNKDFKINILNGKTLYNYLPNIRKDINQLNLAQKSDYIRVALLKRYGGIWLDADTIVMRNLTPIINKLNQKYDYVGFGCSYLVCDSIRSGYPKPSNGAMASKSNGVLITRMLNKLDSFMDNYNNNKNTKLNYFDMGKKIIWKSIAELQNETNYEYYHYNSEYDGSRDITGRWINANNHISKTPTEFLDKNKLFFVFLANNVLTKKYNWFIKLNKKQILGGNWWISQLFRESLDMV